MDSVTDLFNKIRRGNQMIITLTKVLANKVREYQGRKQWPVITREFGDKAWVTLECHFQPNEGQVFDVAIVEKPNPKGGFYRNATIIGPAGQPAQQQAQPKQPAQPVQQNAPAGQPGPITISDGFSRTYPGIQPSKISFEDWGRAASSAWTLGVALGMPAAECVAFVSTTLIAFSNGKLELPKVDDSEFGDVPPSDDIPF